MSIPYGPDLTRAASSAGRLPARGPGGPSSLLHYGHDPSPPDAAHRRRAPRRSGPLTAFVLTALGAALAVGLELLEALAIVLAVAATRSWRDALLGASGAVVLLGAAVAVIGPLLQGLALAPLKVVIGTALLLFGLEWLRKGVLRLAGRRAPASALREYHEEREALAGDAPPGGGGPDWAARVVAGKGVLLEGLEVVLIVSALAAGPKGLAPALAGSAVALAAVLAIGAALHRPLARLPESHLKYAVGVVLSAFGVFFLGEGLRVQWPLGDAALLYLVGALAVVSQLQVAALARTRAAVA